MWSKITSDFKARYSDLDLIAVDFFDTLVCRRYAPPSEIWFLFAERLQDFLGNPGKLCSKQLVESRRLSELSRREYWASHGLSPECTHEEIFEDFLYRVKAYFDSDLPNSSELSNLEFSIDLSYLSVVSGAKEFLKIVKDSGKQVVIISDTYYSRNQIRLILTELGLDQFIGEVFTSSHYRRSKSSGDLYDIAMREVGVSPSKSLHIGDNYHSDVIMARKSGLHTLHFHDQDEISRRQSISDGTATLYKSLNYCRVPTVSTSKYRMLSTRVASTAFDLGFSSFGKIFVGFAYTVSELIARNSYDRIYFVERDGFLIRLLYEKLLSEHRRFRHLPRPPINTLELDRTFVSLALCGSMKDVAPILTPQFLEKPVEDIIGHLSNSLPSLNKTLNLQKDNGNLAYKKKLGEFIADTSGQNEVLTLCAELNDRLVMYLRQIGYTDDGKQLIVDIGWAGSIPRDLSLIVNKVNPATVTEIAYFGYTGRCNNEVNSITFLEGYAYDVRQSRPFEKGIRDYREFFEVISASDRGHFYGLQRNIDSTISTVYGSFNGGVEEQILRSLMRDGVIAYADEFINLTEASALHKSEFLRAALESAIRAIEFPSTDQFLVYDKINFDFGRGPGTRVKLSSLCPRYPSETPPSYLSQPPDSESSASEAVAGSDQNLLQSFFESSYRLINRLSIEEKLIVVYGVGTVSGVIALHLIHKIRFFIDRSDSLRGSTYLGKEVKGIDDGLRDVGDSLVVVTPIGRREQISRMLRTDGCKHIFIEDYVALHSW